MGNPIKTKIQLRRDLLTAWEATDPVLAEGEVALVATSGSSISATDETTASNQKWKIKIGDGIHHFTKLPDIAYADSGSDAKITYISTEYNNLTSFIAPVSSHWDGAYSTITATSATWNQITGVSSNYVKISDNQTLSTKVDNLSTHVGNNYVLTSVNNALSTKVNNLSTYAGNLSTYAGNLSTRLNADEGKYVLTSVNNTLSNRVNKLVQTSSNWDAAYANIATVDTAISDLCSDVTSLQNKSSNWDTAYELANNLSTRLSGDEGKYVLTSDNQTLSTKVDNLVNDSAVTLSSGGRTGDVFKYLLKQGTSEVGVIEVPYDVFVNKGELSTVDNKTYLMLTLNNEQSTVISIAVDSLVNIYTGLSTETIDVVVDNYQISAEVRDKAITTAKIDDKAVTGGANGKIALSTITTNNLATNAVYTGNINDKAVTGGANGKIALSTITIDNLASNAVETRAIKDSAVTTAKIDDKAVTGGANGKIALSTITTNNLATNAVYTGNINDSAVTTAKINDGAVTPAKMYSDGVFVFDCGDANAPQPS